jgi:2'-5' RNA ligase
MDANKKARRIFGGTSEEEYMPHMSLFYGKLAQKTKEEIKKKIMAKAGRKFPINFEVKNIRLLLTDGEPKEWRMVKEFPLQLTRTGNSSRCHRT